MLRTRITDFFGITRPIVQGGLMWITRSELASAVGNAGGIGFVKDIPTCQELLDRIMTEAKQIIQEKFS